MRANIQSEIESAFRALGMRTVALLTRATYGVARQHQAKDAADWFKHVALHRSHHLRLGRACSTCEAWSGGLGAALPRL